MNFFSQLDTSVFYFLNQTIANPILDKVMPYITDVHSWYLVYIFGILGLIWKGGKNGRYAALALILGVVLTDQFNSEILKDMFGRLRPCKTLDDVRLLVNCGSGKSFPSSHAANNFAAAFILTRYYPKNWILYYFVAFLMALSRPYVGVHYPSDILGGAIVGVAMGFVVISIVNLLEKQLEKKAK